MTYVWFNIMYGWCYMQLHSEFEYISNKRVIATDWAENRTVVCSRSTLFTLGLVLSRIQHNPNASFQFNCILFLEETRTSIWKKEVIV